MAKKQPNTDISNNELLTLIVGQLENKSNDYYKEFDDIKVTLKELDKKVGIQNGRVTMLEYKHSECPIKVVAKETEIIRMIFRYPNLSKRLFLFFVAIMLGSGILSIVKMFV